MALEMQISFTAFCNAQDVLQLPKMNYAVSEYFATILSVRDQHHIGSD